MTFTDADWRVANGLVIRGAAWSTAVAAVLALGLAGCQQRPETTIPTEIEASRAVEIARAFVVAGQPADYVFLELTNEPPQRVGQVWRMKVDAHVRIPQIPPTDSLFHFIIDVDRATGVRTIFAQG